MPQLANLSDVSGSKGSVLLMQMAEQFFLVKLGI